MLGPKAKYAYEIIEAELHELECISDDLEEIGDHFGEKKAKYQSGGIYRKSERVYDCKLSIETSLFILVEAIKESA